MVLVFQFSEYCRPTCIEFLNERGSDLNQVAKLNYANESDCWYQNHVNALKSRDTLSLELVRPTGEVRN